MSMLMQPWGLWIKLLPMELSKKVGRKRERASAKEASMATATSYGVFRLCWLIPNVEAASASSGRLGHTSTSIISRLWPKRDRDRGSIVIMEGARGLMPQSHQNVFWSGFSREIVGNCVYKWMLAPSLFTLLESEMRTFDVGSCWCDQPLSCARS